MYARRGSRGYLSGFGAIVAESLTTSGNVSAAILEFAANASGPGVRCSTDADTGIGRDAANQMTVWSGGTAVARGLAGSGFHVLTGIELVGIGMFETRTRERKSWRTAVAVVAATQITIVGAMRVPVDPSGGSATSTAAPLLSGSPADGDEIWLINIHASNTYTINNHGNAGVDSQCLLGAATRQLRANGGYLGLRWHASAGRAYEIGFG